MTLLKQSITYGSKQIAYSVHYRQRKTLEIVVEPDCSVVVAAPVNADLKIVAEKVRKRAAWINRQKDYFRQFEPRTPQRMYVSGETHLYLGRQFRLKLHKSPKNSVKLVDGFFHVYLPDKSDNGMVKNLMENWYHEKAVIKFTDSFERCRPRFAKMKVPTPHMHIQLLKKRWGSLSAKHRLTLNLGLIRAPRECIDYVVTHELCHLKFSNHGNEFFKLLDKIMPDWKRRKERLERVGS